jgi:hypothetical protein
MRMRRSKLATWLVTPIALALGVFVIGAVDVSVTGADIYGVGGGSINLGGSVKAKFAFSAHTGPQGDYGSFRFTREDLMFDVHVDVDCVNVFSHVFPFPPGAGAWIGGTVTKVTPLPNTFGIMPGNQLLFGVNDFGEPSDPVPDELDGFFGSPQLCKNLPPGAFMQIDQGNIVIKTG